LRFQFILHNLWHVEFGTYPLGDGKERIEIVGPMRPAMEDVGVEIEMLGAGVLFADIIPQLARFPRIHLVPDCAAEFFKAVRLEQVDPVILCETARNVALFDARRNDVDHAFRLLVGHV
jgi:hypothetical protein